MNESIAVLFLVGPLLVIPLGLRLIPSLEAAPADRLLAVARPLAWPAGWALAVAFILPVGPVAGLFTVPWLLVCGLGVAATLFSVAAAGRRGGLWRAGPHHLTWAALAFLAVGAASAFAMRVGFETFGITPTIVLLTAVHFTFAGFVLALSGSLAYRARPARWLEAGLGALVVGIPITAVGFLGVALAGWLGALLVSGGGLSVGTAMLLVAPSIPGRTARWLGRIAGASLMVSMPLAVVYATGTFTGSAWLDLPTMARTHGAINVVGFAVPSMLAWSWRARDGR